MFIFIPFCFIIIGLNGVATDSDPKLDELKIEEIKTNKSEEIKVLPGGGGIGANDNIGNGNGTLPTATDELEIDETKGNRTDDSKIHHGLPIKNIAEFPFMVSLWVGGKRLCTASLISPSHILSAAHCFGLEGNYSILAGTVDAIQNNTKSIGKNIVKAHIYSEDLLGKDLAIGVLEEPLNISAETHHVKLSKRTNLVNSSAYIAGWGRVDDGSAPITLQGAKVTIWPNNEEKCDGVLETELCAFGSEGENTCFGDSGGPLLYKNAKSNEWEQIGITSRGSWLCEHKGFFTTIQLYCDWIKKITEGKAQCE